MKSDKECSMNERCRSCWHEILGLALLVIATILTIVTCNSIGIAAMFLVALVLCCYKCLAHHCMHHHCCSSYDHCHDDTECKMQSEEKSSAKRASSKAK